MKDVDYEIVDDISPDDQLWEDWNAVTKAERWVNAADDSTLALTRQFAKAVVARSRTDGSFLGSVVWCESDGLAYIGFYILRPQYRGLGIGTAIWQRALERIPSSCTLGLRSDGSFLGSVVWCESDGLAYIGFYILRPEYRGLGIGTAIWQHALERIPCSCTLGLRSVENMVARYKAKDTPVEGQAVAAQRIRVVDLIDIAMAHLLQQSTTKLVSDLSAKEFDAMVGYANEVSGRDRSQLLRLHFDLDCTEGAVLVDSTGRIRAFASAVTTGPQDEHLYKIAPIYADGIGEAFTVIHPLLVKIHTEDPEAVALIRTWNDSAGEQLRALISDRCTVSEISAYTLFSRSYHNPMDFKRMFAAHNHFGQFDA